MAIFPGFSRHPHSSTKVIEIQDKLCSPQVGVFAVFNGQLEFPSVKGPLDS